MYKTKLLLPLILCAMLQACATGNKSSTTQSSAQTQTLVPTVNCGEGAPYATLPAYPVAPAEETVQSLKSYVTLQFVWAVQASGALAAEKAKRANLEKCLSSLRAQGIIN